MGSQSQQSPNEMYNLKWNSYSSNLIKVFFDHHEHEFLVDVTLSCEKNFIKAHRLVLSACSGYFAKVFELHTSPNFMILMNNVKYKYLKLIVQYMYQGEVRVADEDIQDFLALGKILEVKGLCSVELNDGDVGAKPVAKRTNEGNKKANECITPEKILPFPVLQKTDADVHNPIKKRKTSPITTIPTLLPPAQPVKLRSDLLKMESRLVHTPLPTVLQQPKSILRVDSALIRRTVPKSLPNNSDKNFQRKPNIKHLNAPLLSDSQPQEEDSSKSGSHIPRPPNAFMIFANQWRKKLAVEYPNDSNKDISVKLGSMWKGLDSENKEIFYREAEKASREHRLKYPGYTYSPKEARERKAEAKKLSENQATSDVETLDDDDEVRLKIDEDFKDMVVEVDCDD